MREHIRTHVFACVRACAHVPILCALTVRIYDHQQTCANEIFGVEYSWSNAHINRMYAETCFFSLVHANVSTWGWRRPYATPCVCAYPACERQATWQDAKWHSRAWVVCDKAIMSNHQFLQQKYGEFWREGNPSANAVSLDIFLDGYIYKRMLTVKTWMNCPSAWLPAMSRPANHTISTLEADEQPY